MARERTIRREVLVFVVSTGLALFSAFQMIGHTVRAVHVLSIFAGGLGVGASLANLRRRLRERSAERERT
jgi:hypothetical protein